MKKLFKLIITSFRRFRARKDMVRKVGEATDIVMDRYQGALKKLAEYDRA